MDTTETYIKMCDCEEIQTEHEYVDGDLYSERCHYQNGMTAIFNEFYCSDCDRELQQDSSKWIWLPRQDQLQEMVINRFGGDVYELLTRFCDFAGDTTTEIENSMEQLWLAFVMKEKFGKVWSNDKWVKGV